MVRLQHLCLTHSAPPGGRGRVLGALHPPSPGGDSRTPLRVPLPVLSTPCAGSWTRPAIRLAVDSAQRRQMTNGDQANTWVLDGHCVRKDAHSWATPTAPVKAPPTPCPTRCLAGAVSNWEVNLWRRHCAQEETGWDADPQSMASRNSCVRIPGSQGPGPTPYPLGCGGC